MGTYDGVDEQELARRLGVPRVTALDEVRSTQDVAHSLAAGGVPAGTLVLADAQSSGRGRMGRAWVSEPGAGVWLTLIERPIGGAALEVLSLRVGLALAPVLEVFSPHPIRLKWPNDIYTADRKLGGVLIEARWRDGMPEWVAIGVGINVSAPAGEPRGIGFGPGATRLSVLEAVVPAIRMAAARSGALTDRELAEFAARDFAAGRVCIEPIAGRVIGIDGSGALLVDVGSSISAVRAGSLVLEAGPDA